LHRNYLLSWSIYLHTPYWGYTIEWNTCKTRRYFIWCTQRVSARAFIWYPHSQKIGKPNKCDRSISVLGYTYIYATNDYHHQSLWVAFPFMTRCTRLHWSHTLIKRSCGVAGGIQCYYDRCLTPLLFNNIFWYSIVLFIVLV
jgi:hypothetical protein